MQTINKHSVLKTVREKGEWNGYIAPNKVNSFHINNGWHLGMDITIVFGSSENPNDYIILTGNDNQKTFKLDDFINEFSYYNCNSELGNRVRFWEN